MILYSTVPLEAVFEGFDQEKPAYEEVEYAGVPMVVEPIGARQGRIMRLLSTDPAHYLRNDLAPGNIIEFH